ncbi:MAG: hypothetical protein WD396_11625 [Pseudohongiellaceae bacterium]
MKCEFHPNVPAAALCNSCKTPVCGICSRYSDDTVLCERCDHAGALSRFVETQARKAGKPVDKFDELIEEDKRRTRAAPSPKPQKQKTDKSERAQIAIVIVCCLFIAFRIAFSLSSNAPLSAPQIQAQETQRNRIEECMLVFWEVAGLLRDGRTPQSGMRCPGTAAPLQISNVDGDIVVRHPDPQSLGLADIYVTRSNPTPIVVQQ